MESYVEHPPVPGLVGWVRTVWIQRTGAVPYLQRHLPTGGVEIHVPIGGRPRLLGPLTGPVVEVVAAHTTIVGVRFRPGAAPPLPAVLDDLVDQRLGLAELWGDSVDRIVEAVAGAATPERALVRLQVHLLRQLRAAVRTDPLVHEAVQVLMPWHPVDIGALATHLALSASQLRRRCLHAVGVSPKVLQRILRFQGFLALAQAGATASGRGGADGVAGLAVDAGYADQAHLSRECSRFADVASMGPDRVSKRSVRMASAMACRFSPCMSRRAIPRPRGRPARPLRA